jgi:hypothetical protein
MSRLGSLFVMLTMWLPIGLLAQEVSLRASTKTTVEVGEQFSLVYELNADGSGFQGPDFRGFTVLTGPMISTSSSIQIINGKVDRTYTQTFTYILSAPSEGEFTIEPASVTVDSKRITSNRISMKVVSASTPQRPQAGRGQQSQAGGLSSKDLFLRAIPDKRNAVVGEQVIVTYRIYTRVPLSQLQVTKLSSFPGFWTKNLLDESQGLQQSQQVIDGVEYTVADVRKVALFPQKTGQLTIEPMELECIAQVRTQPDRQRPRDPFESFFNDPFFNRNIQNVQQKLVSESVTVNVEAVPTTRRPQSFAGAVGQFGFSASINRTEVDANDAINLSFTITGTGNLELIDFPRPEFPASFEVYDPKISADIKTSSSGLSGSRKAEYLIIPRFEGDFKIDPVEFGYYDPKKQEFVTLSSQGFEIRVNKGSGESPRDGIFASTREGVRYLASDIRHIKLVPGRLQAIDHYFFGSTTYFLLLIASLLLFVTALIYTLKQQKLRQNQSLLRYRKATKVARRKLKSAHELLKKKQQNEFYQEMSQALWGYLADKFTIQRSELSIDNVQTVLQSKEAPESLVQDFVDTLNKCEYARFAPGDEGKKMDELYQQGIEVISNAERTIKS